MSDRLDSFARRAAQPMTRARALKLAGGAFVAATFPGAVASPALGGRGRARAAGFSVDCNRPWNPENGELCWTYAKGYEGYLCIRTGCKGDDSECCVNPGYNVSCCRPGQLCESQGEYAICTGCASDETKCGETCCPHGQDCADPASNYCCGPREKGCRGGGKSDCCGQRQACCNGKCCKEGLRCHKGRCRKCPPKTRKCGNRQCCEKGEECCDGKCCTKKQNCCGDHCCDKGDSCCGPDCCSDRQKCCGDHCCDKGEDCCGAGCCAEGQTCAMHEERRVKTCCPSGRLVRTRFGAFCCRTGDVATGDRCCPRSRPNCNECDPPCQAGQVCRDGYCL